MTNHYAHREICQLRLKLKRECGSTSVEYVLVTIAVFGALFVPFPGSQGLSAVGLLLTGLRNFQMHTTFLLSLP